MYVSTPKYSYFISPIVPLKQVTGFQNVPFVFTYHVSCLRSQNMRNRVACIVINNYTVCRHHVSVVNDFDDTVSR